MLDKTWIVVPAYNEASVIANTLHGLRDVFSNIVVVDDCSTDATAKLSARFAHVCRHPVNLGQGAALQTGIDYALAQGAELIVTFDSDGQHRPIDALEMVNALTAGNYEVILASRFLGSITGMSMTRGAVLRLATMYTRLATGLNLTDTHNGLRAFKRSAAQKIRLRQNRMAHASEILDQIARNKISFKEYPVTILYTQYSQGKGQKLWGLFSILSDTYLRRMYR